MSNFNKVNRCIQMVIYLGFISGGCFLGIPGVMGDDSLVASTYLGGIGSDGAWPDSVCTVDDQGFVYVTGITTSDPFPVSSGAYDETFNGGSSDVFITKFSPGLNAVIASTYVGGTGSDRGRAIFFGPDGYLYVAGITDSVDFPVTVGSYDATYNGSDPSPYGDGDTFIIRINTALTDISAGTYLGGSGHDIVNKIRFTRGGQVVVAGETSSADFPVTAGAYCTTIHPGGNFADDVFVAVLTSDLSGLTAATYLGGTKDDFCEGIAVGQQGGIFVGGWTSSRDFPTTAGAFDTDYNGFNFDSFVSKFDDSLTSLTASTYLGGSSWEFIYAMAIGTDDTVYVAGHTASTDFPVSANAYDPSYNSDQGPDSGDDVFVTQLNTSLSAVSASTYLGGEKWENAYSLAVSSQGVFVAGSTSSLDFPVGENSLQPENAGGTKYSGDSFVTHLKSDLTVLEGSTYLGGSGSDGGQWLAMQATGDVYLCGMTDSVDFPVTAGAFQGLYQGGASDVYIVRMNPELTGNPPATPSATPSITPSPTPEPGCHLGVTLWMPSHHFFPGADCGCTVTVCNDTGADLHNVPLFVILEVAGLVFFAPSFSDVYDNYLASHSSFGPGETQVEVLPGFSWPEDTGEASGIFWYAGMTDPEITTLMGDYDYWEFSWSDVP